jgi:hypothetical protein
MPNSAMKNWNGPPSTIAFVADRRSDFDVQQA